MGGKGVRHKKYVWENDKNGCIAFTSIYNCTVILPQKYIVNLEENSENMGRKFLKKKKLFLDLKSVKYPLISIE